ncbi:MAG: peroxiredoxin family protein [Thermodesulfobacteriota bacterium]
MMQIRKRGFLLMLAPLFCFPIPGGFAFGQGTQKVARSGDLFAPHTFPPPISSQDLSYLGLTEEKPFTLGDIQADLIVLELLNIYCTSCQKQAPIYNEVFDLVEKDPTMKGKVKWMGVGVGNNETEVDFFRKAKRIPFPILPDIHFNLYQAIGGPGGIRTPLTLLIRKDKKGRGIVIDSHMGFRGNKRELLDEINAALQYDLAYLSVEKGKRIALPVTEKLKPPISDEELLKKIKEGMAPPGGVVGEIRRIPPEEQYLYMAKVEVNAEKKYSFAKVVSWPPLCDICHDIHFIYVFDEEAKITNFIPIHLPKEYNKVWDERDIEAMKSRLIGRSLLKPFEFNRDVDAVSGATITSVVIFHRHNEGKKAYTRLIKQGYVK